MRTNSDGTASVDLQLCAVVAELVVALAGTALSHHTIPAQVVELKKAVAMLTGKMAAWFPFDATLGDRSQRVSTDVPKHSPEYTVSLSLDDVFTAIKLDS
jgi:hypothetical protein